MNNVRLQLNEFFISVQARTLSQIQFAVKDRDEALDILQDAMIRLAKKYADKEPDWPKLFQRIVQNLICDWHRRKKVRNIFVWWAKPTDEDEGSPRIEDLVVGCDLETPDRIRQGGQIADYVVQAIEQLPFRQQQVFTLRAWWGHDIHETAFAMGCSEGSVKTHYSRATSRLRDLLGDIDL
ncbi:MAG: RNA polymerase sigma factor [Agarilytica sp.]